MKPFGSQDDISEDPDFLNKGKGLYGGTGAKRKEHGHVSRLEHALLLDPFGDETEAARIDTFMGGDSPLEIEIGFGRGAFFFAHAAAIADRRFLGFEVKTRDCALLMNRLSKRGDQHARVIQGDARPLFARLIGPEQVARIHINFPDPWWKKRHHKRRVFSASFIDLMHSRLKPDGCVAVRTDVADYAHLIEELFAQHGGFQKTPLGKDTLAPTWREIRCRDYGLPVHGMLFEKTGPPLEEVSR